MFKNIAKSISRFIVGPRESFKQDSDFTEYAYLTTKGPIKFEGKNFYTYKDNRKYIYNKAFDMWFVTRKFNIIHLNCMHSPYKFTKYTLEEFASKETIIANYLLKSKVLSDDLQYYKNKLKAALDNSFTVIE